MTSNKMLLDGASVPAADNIVAYANPDMDLSEDSSWSVRAGSQRPPRGFSPAWMYNRETGQWIAVSADTAVMPDAVYELACALGGEAVGFDSATDSFGDLVARADQLRARFGIHRDVQWSVTSVLSDADRNELLAHKSAVWKAVQLLDESHLNFIRMEAASTAGEYDDELEEFWRNMSAEAFGS